MADSHSSFSNSTGVLGPEAVRCFAALGQLKVASVVERALSMLGSSYPRDRAVRWSVLYALSGITAGQGEGEQYRVFSSLCKGLHPVFGPVQKEFYALLPTEAGGLETAADAYAEKLRPE